MHTMLGMYWDQRFFIGKETYVNEECMHIQQAMTNFAVAELQQQHIVYWFRMRLGEIVEIAR